MKNLSAIVSVSNTWTIGNNGEMPWRQSDDLKRFKNLTTDHIVIMGKKTFKSIGGLLSKRINIIITRDKSFKAFGCYVVHSIEEALKLSIEIIDGGLFGVENEVFVIGGGEIYDQMLPICSKVYLTLINCDIEGDTHFPKIEHGWNLVSYEYHSADNDNDFDYTFKNYIRR